MSTDNPFAGLFGIGRTNVPKVNPAIAAAVWMEKQPIFGKLPKEDDSTIKINTGDFRRIVKAAYEAGFERGAK